MASCSCEIKVPQWHFELLYSSNYYWSAPRGVHEHRWGHGLLRTPREEIAFTARLKIQSQSQIFRYGLSIFCVPHRPNFSDSFDLCLHWVSVVRGMGLLPINHKLNDDSIQSALSINIGGWWYKTCWSVSWINNNYGYLGRTGHKSIKMAIRPQ